MRQEYAIKAVPFRADLSAQCHELCFSGNCLINLWTGECKADCVGVVLQFQLGSLGGRHREGLGLTGHEAGK